MTDKDIDLLKADLLPLLQAKELDLRFNKWKYTFPDEGEFRRELYAKHILFMDASLEYFQRALVGANRVGKTRAVSYELTCHLTGIYPKWWKGRRFLNPVNVWVASKTFRDTRDIIQKELVGTLDEEGYGTGLIPKDKLHNPKRVPPGCLDSVQVKHISGGLSQVGFKSFDQGRESFQGVKMDIIWLDEEPRDEAIYSECLMRLADKFNPGMLIMTFMPLFGLTNILLSFAPGGKFYPNGVNPKNPHKFAMNIGWDDCPHLSEAWKEEASKSMAPHEKRARMLGLPGLGAGAIYPYLEEDIVVSPFKIPDYWEKAYGLDVGWKCTACLWAARNPDTGEIFLYREHYKGYDHASVHAKAIKHPEDWLTGVIDIASVGSSQVDGKKLIDLYISEGLDLETCDNTVEAGILYIGELFASGKLKVFSTLLNFLEEFNTYSRNEKGEIRKKKDHLMDAMRYLLLAFDDICRTKPIYARNETVSTNRTKAGRNSVTGY